MKRSWNTLSQQSNGMYAVADFERAAYRLVTEQVLYASDARSRSAYHLVEAYLEDFAAALDPLGIRLERNAHHRYVVALPKHGEGTPVRLDETLFLLVLRQRYDEGMKQGLVEELGEVVVELPELQEAWPALTGRPMPEVGALRALAATARRWGVCRLVEGEPDDLQPFHLVVRPAIVDIVGEQWLHRLDQHNLGGADAEADAGDDAGDTEDDHAAA
ncbi:MULTISPECIES: DUF4194 domain-containing protein [Pseudoxanthomonas]|uniref:Uncharacterized protein DUF4194 n=1 Tax=Pseudoxanthomonas taiwanensis J19 TaxID=935569 RepID=A0A562DKW4_9GAMM|nr:MULTISPECIES: DUF4194 domain-containing protein [Pseudoxanthomonas]RRN79872.1 DUF4194 domain-containing protein [Pseudoxanthomonas sp. SGD-10]TWH04252.1 uncharacterized protein DUF4194 [Pseudoxanthomonas taiwanensis J19]TWH10187.1 uncharacterized protein DUF4194 [Pseudoxanthomonas taiwanensis J19]